MSCCGGKRRAARTAGPRAPAPHVPVVPPPPLHPTAAVRYAGAHPVVLRGAASGRVYLFDAGATVDVEARDVPAMLRLPPFSAASRA